MFITHHDSVSRYAIKISRQVYIVFEEILKLYFRLDLKWLDEYRMREHGHSQLHPSTHPLVKLCCSHTSRVLQSRQPRDRTSPASGKDVRYCNLQERPLLSLSFCLDLYLFLRFPLSFISLFKYLSRSLTPYLL